uniref:CTCK domain-containing protein n=1 Tax=Eutreptiella gymnastica TaxID=73025 RepID=A0A7S4D307_9EUGL
MWPLVLILLIGMTHGETMEVLRLDTAGVDRAEIDVGIPVPVVLCRRVPKVIKIAEYDRGQWSLKDPTQTTVDVGECQGFCLTTAQTGRKSCEAVTTDSVQLTDAKSRRTSWLSVVKECACVCDRIERCPEGWFWNAWHCRCEPKVLPNPCTRLSVYKHLGDFSVDVGMCRGDCHWKGGFAYCRPLTFETQTVTNPYGGAVSTRVIDDCGCSDCRVRAKYRLIKVDEDDVRKVNVGVCGGECGPEEWPTGQNNLEQYWTTQCHVAETKMLLVGNVRVEAVARCDCKPVRPKCARIPHYIQHWGPDGTVQVVDVGRCLGRCGSASQKCIPKFEESIICADPTAQVECGPAPCDDGYTCQPKPGSDCDPTQGGTDCPGTCVPNCDRFKVITDCHCDG